MRIAVAPEASQGSGIAPTDDLFEVRVQSGASIKPNSTTISSEVELDGAEPDERSVLTGANIDIPCAHHIVNLSDGYNRLHRSVYRTTPVTISKPNLDLTMAANVLNSASGGLAGVAKGTPFCLYGVGSLAGWYVAAENSTANTLPVQPIPVAFPDVGASQAVSLYSSYLIPGAHTDTLALEGDPNTSKLTHCKGLMVKTSALSFTGDNLVTNKFTGIATTWAKSDTSMSDHEWIDSGYSHAQTNRLGETVVYVRKHADMAFRLILDKLDLTLDNGATNESAIDGLRTTTAQKYLSVKGNLSGRYEDGFPENYLSGQAAYSSVVHERAMNGAQYVIHIPNVALTDYNEADEKGKDYTKVDSPIQGRKVGDVPVIFMAYFPPTFPV